MSPIPWELATFALIFVVGQLAGFAWRQGRRIAVLEGERRVDTTPLDAPDGGHACGPSCIVIGDPRTYQRILSMLNEIDNKRYACRVSGWTT